LAREDIHKDGEKTQFSKESQPTPEAKSEGWKKRRTLKELADALLNLKGIEKAKETAIAVGMDLSDDEFTLEIVMTLRQIEKALKKGDTPAYNAAMDRMVGKPLASIEVDNTHKFDPDQMKSWLDKFSSKVQPDKIDDL